MTPMEKRRPRDEAEHAPSVESKRPKIIDGDDKNGISPSIGAHELASAFALASLATMSPTRQVTSETAYESRDADHFDEAVPVSPDVRSPIRSQSKRVTFSNDTKVTSRMTPRKLSYPPRTKQQGSRMPPGFARLPYHPRYQQHQHLPPPWMDQRMMANQHRQQPPFRSMPPPPPVHSPPPPSPHRVHSSPPPQSDKWICDFCNIAAFDTYQEACRHEETCRVRCSMHQEQVRDWHAAAQARAMYHPPGHNMDYVPTHVASSRLHCEARAWYQGATCLAIPESDRDWLSEVHCLIRERCVEVFSATSDDVRALSERGSASLHQVGVRCRYCLHRPRDEVLPDAVSFPTSVSDIYECVKRMQKSHLEVCQYIPHEIKSKLESGSASAWVPTTRQYWIDSARSLGLVDTQNGVRFSTDPKNIPEYCLPDFQSSRAEVPGESETEADSVVRESEIRSLGDGDSLVKPEDMSMVPAYVYFLMRQVETTHFTEADRFVARSKGPVGYSGFQCRHCQGHAGLGKYFPVSAKSLSTNSTSQNIHSHLLKCRKVTPFVKEQLIALKDEKSKAPRLEPGWRRIFFEKIWSRLHE